MPTGEFDNWIDLSCHPASRADALRTVRARVHRSDSKLHIGYRLQGDIVRILVPPAGEPLIGTELWRHTCFETFLRTEGAAAYYEFNFAPSRQWTIYAFSAYRSGAPLADPAMNPQIAIRSSTNLLELDATIQLDRLSSLSTNANLRLGLAAVVETSNGLSYWALHHPADKPDFHNSAGFVLTLAPL